MKKVILFLVFVICSIVTLFAQENRVFSYQAVIRDRENRLVADAELTLTMSVSNSEDGPVVYRESHTARSNANGMVSLSVGGGTPTYGSWSAITWNTAHISVSVTRGNEVLSSYSMPISAVPYSLYSDYADSVNADMLNNYLRHNGYLTQEVQELSLNEDTLFLTGGSYVILPSAFDGDYNDLTNKPTIPTRVSELQNDAGYLTSVDIQEAANIPTVVSAFQNDAGYLTKDSATIVNMQGDITRLSTSLTQLADKESTDSVALANAISAVKSDVTELAAKESADSVDLANAIQTAATNLSNKEQADSTAIHDALIDTANAIRADIPVVNDATLKVKVGDAEHTFSANAAQGTTVTLSTVAGTGSYNDLLDKPDLSEAANDGKIVIQKNGVAVDSFTVNQSDNKTINIVIPTNVSEFNNDAQYLTEATVQEAANIPTVVSAFQNDAGYLTKDSATIVNMQGDITRLSTSLTQLADKESTDSVALANAISAVKSDVTELAAKESADSVDLANAIQTAATNLSNKEQADSTAIHDALIDTANAIRADIPVVNDATLKVKVGDAEHTFSANAAQGTTVTLSTVAGTGSYNDLLDKPDLSEAANDGKIVIQKNGVAVDSFTVNQSTDKRINIVIPTNVSEFTNDAQYLTEATVQEAANIPTRVSAFQNDAGYLTKDSATIVNMKGNITQLSTNLTQLAGKESADSVALAGAIATVKTDVTTLAAKESADSVALADAISVVKTDVTTLAAKESTDSVALANEIQTVSTTLANKEHADSTALHDVLIDTAAAIRADFPVVNDAMLTVKVGEAEQTFSANAAQGTTVTLSKVAGTGSYNDLLDRPDLSEAANDGKIVIQKNGVAVDSFTVNQSDNKTINIVIPTNVSEFINDAEYLTEATVQEAANIPTRVSAFQNDAGYLTKDSTTIVNMQGNIMQLSTNLTQLAGKESADSVALAGAIATVKTDVTTLAAKESADSVALADAISAVKTDVTTLAAKESTDSVALAEAIATVKTGLTTLAAKESTDSVALAGAIAAVKSDVTTLAAKESTDSVALANEIQTVSTTLANKEHADSTALHDALIDTANAIRHNIPKVNDGVLTIKVGNTVKTFSANATDSTSVTLSKVAGTGNYNDLSDRPVNLSQFNNDMHFITAATDTAGNIISTEIDPLFTAWGKNYNTLNNIPNDLVHDSAYVHTDNNYTIAEKTKLLGIEAEAEVNVQADWNQTSSSADDFIKNKPTVVSAFTNDAKYITTAPVHDTAVVLRSEMAAQKTNLQSNIDSTSLHVRKALKDTASAIRGAIPTKTSELTNNSGFITSADVPEQVNADWNATEGAAQILNKPTIPTVPTNVSAFTNDAKYITTAPVHDTAAVLRTEMAAQELAVQGNIDSTSRQVRKALRDTASAIRGAIPTQVSAFNNDAGYITSAAIPTNVSTFTNDANYITSAAIPTQVSAFDNDANYITAADIPAQTNADWNATSGAAQILNKPEIPTKTGDLENNSGFITSAAIPTNVGAFTNDANYITAADIPAQTNADWNATSGAAQILNKPEIPTVPTNVSAFNNDANYITSADIPAQTNADWNATSGAAQILNKPEIPTKTGDLENNSGFITSAAIPTNVGAFTNDANYITAADIPAQTNADWNATSGAAQILNKPEIPTVPTNVSAFNNDANYITSADIPAQTNADWNATSGAAQILNKPEIPTVPTNVSAFNNDANYITSADIPAQTNADWNATSGAAQILNKPTIPTKTGDLENNSGFITSAAIPTNVGAFTNDANYITAADIPAQTNADWNATSGAAQILNKPEIPTVPTNVSAFTNDAGYLTSYAETDPLFSAWDKSYNDLTDKPVLFSGSYDDLTDKPTIPTVPTNVSAFTNDANYITSADVPAQMNADWDATSGAAQILNKPTIGDKHINIQIESGESMGVTNGEFSLNQGGDDQTVTITIPSAATVDLTPYATKDTLDAYYTKAEVHALFPKEKSKTIIMTETQVSRAYKFNILTGTPNPAYRVKIYINGVLVGDDYQDADNEEFTPVLIVDPDNHVIVYDSWKNEDYKLQKGDKVMIYWFE